MVKQFQTVVFEYEEGAKLPREITEAFKSDSMMFQGVKVTAVSMEDEISRCERLEQGLER